tara:strand:+ start:169 stop:486 length:318 start_codon:yes stop_codon:yes gene_type:complete
MRIITIIVFAIFSSIFLFSCSTIKEGFESQRKNSTEEFLVEKKKPLVMPPDYENLPEPKINENKKSDEEIKELIVGTDKKLSKNKTQNSTGKNFEETIIKKIEQN